MIVNGINKVKRHTKPNPMKNQPGGIVAKEMPIDVSNVTLVDREGKSTCDGYRSGADGDKTRIARATGGEL